jgi:hypothetical protein
MCAENELSLQEIRDTSEDAMAVVRSELSKKRPG